MASSESEDIDDPLACDDDPNDVTYALNSELSDSDNDEYSSSGESDDDRLERKSSKFLLSSNTYRWSKAAEPPEAFVRVRSHGDNQILSATFDDSFLDPLEVFSKIYTNSFINSLVSTTNLDSDDSEDPLNLSEAELRAFLGMLIIMGFHRLPSVRHYWRDDKNFSVPRISSIMTVDRFLRILKSLKYASPATTNKECLTDPLLLHANEIFSQLRSPRGWLTLDESQMQSKSVKYAHNKKKITLLCCSTSGYLFKIKPQETSSSMNEIAESVLSAYEGSGQSVVLGKPHSNFLLAERLFEKKLFVCTRLSVNDPNISKLFPKQQPETEAGDFRQSGNFSVTKWKNRKQYLYILSTRHDPSVTKSVVRTNDRNLKELVDCPETVLDYKNYKCGVELFDQLRYSYAANCKSSDWKKRFFFFFLDAALVNSYILYAEAWQQLKGESVKKIKPLDFRSQIADSLIGSFCVRKRPAKTSAPLVKRLKRGTVNFIDESSMHLPVKCTRRRCAHCSTRNCQRRSAILCSDCQVALCLTCYAPFHTAAT